MWMRSKANVKINLSNASSMLESHGHFILYLSQPPDVSVTLTCWGLSLLVNLVSLHASTATLSLNMLKVLAIRFICLDFSCSFILPKLQIQRSLNWMKWPSDPRALAKAKPQWLKAKGSYFVSSATPDRLLLIYHI